MKPIFECTIIPIDNEEEKFYFDMESVKDFLRFHLYMNETEASVSAMNALVSNQILYANNRFVILKHIRDEKIP